jgi:hypothetical protein
VGPRTAQPLRRFETHRLRDLAGPETWDWLCLLALGVGHAGGIYPQCPPEIEREILLVHWLQYLNTQEHGKLRDRARTTLLANPNPGLQVVDGWPDIIIALDLGCARLLESAARCGLIEAVPPSVDVSEIVSFDTSSVRRSRARPAAEGFENWLSDMDLVGVHERSNSALVRLYQKSLAAQTKPAKFDYLRKVVGRWKRANPLTRNT